MPVQLEFDQDGEVHADRFAVERGRKDVIVHDERLGTYPVAEVSFPFQRAGAQVEAVEKPVGAADEQAVGSDFGAGKLLKGPRFGIFDPVGPKGLAGCVPQCMDLARFSNSSAIFLFMLIPMVLVPLPIGFVAIR